MHTNPEAWQGQNVIGRLPKREAEKIRKDEQRTVLDPKKTTVNKSGQMDLKVQNR